MNLAKSVMSLSTLATFLISFGGKSPCPVWSEQSIFNQIDKILPQIIPPKQASKNRFNLPCI